MLDIFISSMAMAIGCFSLFLIPKEQSKAPLTLMMLCLIFFSAGTIVFEIFPVLTQLYVSLIPVVFFLFVPAFWLYHDAIIDRKRWHWHHKRLKHFATAPIMVLLGIAVLSLSENDFKLMFFSSEPLNNSSLELLAMMFFICVLVWCILSCAYVASIFYRTMKYKEQIKLVYADEAGRNLRWISITSALISFTWVYALAVLAVDERWQNYGVSQTGVLVLLMAIVWVVALNGVKQRPAFEDTREEVNTTTEQPSKKPYERSALNQEDLHRISSKLDAALHQDKVHVKPDLNLLKLSKHVGEPSQYISQTLSQHLNTTFFDFINAARINEAKQLLAKANDSVLEVAYATGFNSRSSFYKAFRQYTNQTPTQYRNTQK